MLLRKFTCLAPVFAFFASGLHAQVTLFSENFNGCALPPGWQVTATGNQNPVWYVGLSQNSDAAGQSIDGSCFLFIDDESTGNNTPGYTLDFVSPAFDASQYATVMLTMDVHYRDWEDANEYLQILVKDGNAEIPISRFDRYRKNSANLADHFSLKYDLALVTQSPAARLIIRYNDANGAWNWWAGVDNIKIVGSGAGTNIVKETFNGCAKPAGWETKAVTGNQNWQFGQIQTGSNALQGGGSMDGTCFAYFDDDALGDVASSIVRLSTPWFDGTTFGKFELNYDAILRYYKESLTVIVENGNGGEFVVKKSSGDIGGPYFPNYAHQTIDISPYRAQQMRVTFEYNDGDDWGWWAGIDNVKITGIGQAMDLCANAVQLSTGAPCLAGDNLSATFEGPPVACADSSIAGIWYRWQADFSGIAKLSTSAKFNDVVSVFTGTCAAPALATCNNRDEHGFTGETTYFTAQSGTQYLFRVSGQEGGFGSPRGELCVQIEQAATPTPPVNDDCVNAIALTANGSCTIGTNANATMSATLPSLDRLARSDVWYKFTADNLAPGEKLEVRSNASFSDIITLYRGGCLAPEEVAGNHHGSVLELPALIPGQTYWVQIAGNFATVEGSLCPQLIKKQPNAPSNDDCVAAVTVPVGGQCTAGNNMNAAPSGYKPSCITAVDRDIWFKFTAPASGSVHINTGAEFEHSLAIWEGNCNDLKQVFCAENPYRCNGYVTAVGLTAGQTYYVQIASWNGAAGLSSGDVCLKILDGQSAPDFQPLALEVKENCTGLGTAELQVNVSGGIPPYSFSGNTNGQALPSGASYLVIVTDATGCEIMKGDTVDNCETSGCVLTAAIAATHPTCFGSSDGALAANLTDGTAPFQYQWSNNAATPTVSGLPAGTYSLTVTDANGCQSALSQTLINPPAIQSAPTIKQPKCSGDANGMIAAGISGGTPSYEYLWSNNATTPSVDGLGPGAYSVIVTDAHGCSATFDMTLADPDPLAVNPVAQQPKCNGGSEGFVHTNVSGGNAPYIYQWSNGFTSPSIDGIPAGTYSLTVTDANGCSTTSSQTLGDPPAIVITPGAIMHPGQGQSNGSIDVSVSGGGGQFEYKWFRNNVLLVTGLEDLNNIPAGNYKLEVTDANGCTVTFTYNLTETVGTHNPGEAFVAEVFPNPSHGSAVLSVAFPHPRTLRLSLSDASGRILHDWTVKHVAEQHIPLDLHDLPAGTYRLRIMTDTDVVTRSVVVGK